MQVKQHGSQPETGAAVSETEVIGSTGHDGAASETGRQTAFFDRSDDLRSAGWKLNRHDLFDERFLRALGGNYSPNDWRFKGRVEQHLARSSLFGNVSARQIVNAVSQVEENQGVRKQEKEDEMTEPP